MCHNGSQLSKGYNMNAIALLSRFAKEHPVIFSTLTLGDVALIVTAAILVSKYIG